MVRKPWEASIHKKNDANTSFKETWVEKNLKSV